MNQLGSALRKIPIVSLLVVTSLLLAGLLNIMNQAQAAVPQRSILISDNQVGASATYVLSFTLSSPEMLGSIKLEFCANDPIIGDPCTVPAGFAVSGAALTNQSGETGFSVYAPGTNANTVVLGRPAVLAAAGPVSYTFDPVINPSTGGSFYARLQTFPSSDASGGETEHGGIALSLNDAVQISTTVPPYLLFCSGVTIGGFDCNNASGDYLNFGNLASGSTSSATSQLLTATNAGSGFAITVSGLTMTSGNNVIGAIAAPDVSRPGVAQFGMNLVANTTPSVGVNPQGAGTAAPSAGYDTANFYTYVSGDTIATAASVDDFRKLTASYIINIPVGQAIGVYATTLTYICLANF